MSLTDLKRLSQGELESFITGAGLPLFRTRQLIHWVYERGVISIGEITEFSKRLREELSDSAYLSSLTLAQRQISHDGTEKFLFALEGDEKVESVLIPEPPRLTLCISSQVGCALRCRFCLTGSLGLKRNLLAHEIIDQVISVSRIIGGEPVTPPHPSLKSGGRENSKITNIVLMGMGEPLANLENVSEALWRMVKLMKISPRRITLSTAGLVPELLKLPEKAPMANIAVSLNATTDEVRDYIMPVNRRYPIRELLSACRGFPLPQRRRITFEYVMLRGINDTPEDARRLAGLLNGIPSKVNLIPFNTFKGSEFQRPEDERVLGFQDILVRHNVTALIRKSKGEDILAACGQLKAGYREREQTTRR